MDEEMITLQNIMPVELAIKRELEYRRKMEVLRKPHQWDLKPLLIIQGPPPSQSGIKREVSASNSKRSSVLELSSSCQAFQKQLGFSCKGSTPSQTRTKRKVLPSSSAQCSSTLQPSSTCHRSAGFVCAVCRVAFATVFHLKQHGETLAHRSKLFQTKRRGENISNPFLCELCNSSCSSCTVMEFHLNGLKHAASLQEFENAKRTRALGSFDANQ